MNDRQPWDEALHTPYVRVRLPATIWCIVASSCAYNWRVHPAGELATLNMPERELLLAVVRILQRAAAASPATWDNQVTEVREYADALAEAFGHPAEPDQKVVESAVEIDDRNE